MNTNKAPQSITPQSTLPIPFTLEQLREDILNIYLLQLRTTYLFTNDKKIWELAGKSGNREGAIWDGTLPPSEFNLAYEDIQESNFSKALEQQYGFGFSGIDNNLCEPMHSETMHSWVAAYLWDLKSSAVVEEWEQFGAEINVSRCIHTCELANARTVLEGGDNFYPFIARDDVNKADGALTVHQMALLAGMEEMTIRTAISRPSANQLIAFKDDRRTLIKIDEAKTWLTAKGRYLPVTRPHGGGGEHLNLEKTGFLSIDGFARAIARRVTHMDESAPQSNVIQQLMDLHMKNVNFQHPDDLLNADLMTKAASILQLPSDLMVLRAREAVLQEDLAQTSRALNDAVAKVHKA